VTSDSGAGLEAFLAAPVERVVKLAPATLIYSVSGTRRSAALAGVSASGHDYMHWSRQQMLACLDLIFRHGVQHILMPVITPSQFSEATPSYREHLWQWLDQGLAGSEALADYQRFGWRVHFPFGDKLTRLRQVSERLKVTRQQPGNCSLWIFIVPEHNLLWEWALTALRQIPVKTAADAIRLIYGEEIPPATLYLDFGKPVVSPDLLPPFLFGVLNCYWSQRPGYSLNQRQLRTILYDYAYVRTTWQEDKTGRAEQALAHRDAWERGPTVGLGVPLGPFWYPAPIRPMPGESS